MKFKKEFKLKIAELSANNKTNDLITLIKNYISDNYTTFINSCDRPNTNAYPLNKFLNWLVSGENLPFKVFIKDGNKKLPFLCFSTLPAVTCPGAAECLKWCYSYKAWRYPASFLRQVQNTLLMHNFSIIKNELIKIVNLPKFQKMNKIDFRLYVDGDFKTANEIKNWMRLLKEIPKINAYGYSKSLHFFKRLKENNFKFPKNYVLNLSNGGKFDFLHNELNKYSFVRGNFEALNIKNKTAKEIKKTYPNKKIFICPLLCGSCTKLGHACGNLTVFKDYSILINKH